MPKRRCRFIIAIIALLGIIVYYRLDPASRELFPKCPFYLLTGCKCPGCGTQRAIHQLMHLDLKKALEYNALMVCSIPLLLLLLVSDYFKERWPRMYVWSRNPVLSWTILAIIILWWILRNIFGW